MKINCRQNFKSKFKHHHSRRDFFVFSLMFVLMFSALSSGIFTVDAAGPVYVSTETELRNAISDAMEPTVIVLTADIQLTGTTLSIDAGKDITLLSSGSGFFKLFGTPGTFTITVADGGILELAGIFVTHLSGDTGRGVHVQTGGILLLSDGEISNNVYTNYGGGVDNAGNFTMTGGKISGNSVTFSDGGVYNEGNFTLINGEISNNTANRSGGVGNVGNFTMSGGKISNNTVTTLGGGIENTFGIFTMTNGEISGNTAGTLGGGIFNYVSFPYVDLYSNIIISGGLIANNTATYGGGVYNEGSFSLSSGTISGNHATIHGGGVFNEDYANTIFTMSGGTISSNTATYGGGGVHSDGNFIMYSGTIANNIAATGGGVQNSGSFSMYNGIISNNTAAFGGGIYLANGSVDLLSGTISGNTASNDGGGVWVAYEDLDKLFVHNGMVFSNNSASVAYNRNPIDDALYYEQIGSNVIWTDPFTQGYNNYDISYKNGTRFILYNVTVNDSYASVSGAGSYQAGDLVTINAGTRPGYTFTGWTVNEGGIILPNTPTATFTMPPTNVVVTANWQVNQTLTGSFRTCPQ